jgi:hypothetical protein
VKRIRKELLGAQATYDRASRAATAARKRVENAQTQLNKLTAGRR